MWFTEEEVTYTNSTWHDVANKGTKRSCVQMLGADRVNDGEPKSITASATPGATGAPIAKEVDVTNMHWT